MRYRRLRPSEVDELSIDVANMVAGFTHASPEAKAQRSYTLMRREGVKRMLVAVTKSEVPAPPPKRTVDAKTGDEALSPGDEPTLVDEKLWQALTVQGLTLDGPTNYDELFESPDDDLLCRLYALNHEASATNVEAVVKKELRVSTD